MVQCLFELKHLFNSSDDVDTALLVSAEGVRQSTIQYLLEHAGANMEVNDRGKTTWDLHVHHMVEVDGYECGQKTLLLRGVPPPALPALLSPKYARMVQEGTRLRVQLPEYLVPCSGGPSCTRIALCCWPHSVLCCRTGDHGHRGVLGHCSCRASLLDEFALSTFISFQWSLTLI
jgi:hypothetical protein